MKVSRRQFVIDSAAIALTSTTPLYARRETLRILIVDGVNNHDWRGVVDLECSKLSSSKAK